MVSEEVCPWGPLDGARWLIGSAPSPSAGGGAPDGVPPVVLLLNTPCRVGKGWTSCAIGFTEGRAPPLFEARGACRSNIELRPRLLPFPAVDAGSLGAGTCTGRPPARVRVGLQRGVRWAWDAKGRSRN